MLELRAWSLQAVCVCGGGGGWHVPASVYMDMYPASMQSEVGTRGLRLEEVMGGWIQL